MNMNQKIARINELYHKSQKEGLTEEEKAGAKTASGRLHCQRPGKSEGSVK